jgi:hypothetical protein
VAISLKSAASDEPALMSTHPIAALWRGMLFLIAAFSTLYAITFVISLILFPQAALIFLLITVVSIKQLLF